MRISILVKGPLFAEAIAFALKHEGSHDVVSVGDESGPLTRIEDLQPEVVLLHASFVEAVPLAEALRKRVPGVRLVVLAAEASDEDFLAWAKIGISGYIEPNASIEDLAATLYRSGAGEVVCAPRLTGKLLERFAGLANTRAAIKCSHGLTPRERDILKLLDEGCCNKIIARRLGISNPTVKNHVHNVLGKLGVKNRGQAASRFRQDILPTIEADTTNLPSMISRNAGFHRASHTPGSHDHSLRG